MHIYKKNNNNFIFTANYKFKILEFQLLLKISLKQHNVIYKTVIHQKLTILKITLIKSFSKIDEAFKLNLDTHEEIKEHL